MASRSESSQRRAFGCLAGGTAVILGLGFFFIRGCEVQRVSMSRPGGSGNILADMFKVVGDAVLQGIGLTIEEITERGEKAREQTSSATKEPDALLLDPSDIGDLDVKTGYRGWTLVTDRRDGSRIMWDFPQHPRPTFYAMNAGDKWPLSWTIYGKVKDGRSPIVAVVEGSVALGWRDRGGTTPLVTIEHVHAHSFFPYSDALYAKQFPAKRLAGMLNAAWLAQKGGPKPLIVIDRREVLREEQQHIAATEDRNRASLFPYKNEQGILAPRPIDPGPNVVFAAPEGVGRYDEEAKTVFDRRSGLTLKFVHGPSRDDDAYMMSLSRGENLIALIELGVEPAWRPGIGETRFVLVNRVTRPRLPDNTRIYGEPIGQKELPLERLVPLLNGYRRFAWNDQGTGHFIIRDGRDNPVSLQR